MDAVEKACYKKVERSRRGRFVDDRFHPPHTLWCVFDLIFFSRVASFDDNDNDNDMTSEQRREVGMARTVYVNGEAYTLDSSDSDTSGHRSPPPPLSGSSFAAPSSSTGRHRYDDDDADEWSTDDDDDDLDGGEPVSDSDDVDDDDDDDDDGGRRLLEERLEAMEDAASATTTTGSNGNNSARTEIPTADQLDGTAGVVVDPRRYRQRRPPRPTESRQDLRAREVRDIMRRRREARRKRQRQRWGEGGSDVDGESTATADESLSSSSGSSPTPSEAELMPPPRKRPRQSRHSRHSRRGSSSRRTTTTTARTTRTAMLTDEVAIERPPIEPRVVRTTRDVAWANEYDPDEPAHLAKGHWVPIMPQYARAIDQLREPGEPTKIDSCDCWGCDYEDYQSTTLYAAQWNRLLNMWKRHCNETREVGSIARNMYLFFCRKILVPEATDAEGSGRRGIKYQQRLAERTVRRQVEGLFVEEDKRLRQALSDHTEPRGDHRNLQRSLKARYSVRPPWTIYAMMYHFVYHTPDPVTSQAREIWLLDELIIAKGEEEALERHQQSGRRRVRTGIERELKTLIELKYFVARQKPEQLAFYNKDRRLPVDGRSFLTQPGGRKFVTQSSHRDTYDRYNS